MKAKRFVSIVYESHYHNLCLEDTRWMHHYVDISTALPYLTIDAAANYSLIEYSMNFLMT